jgi:CubicO group peptidase (beta-lactamase class C family)
MDYIEKIRSTFNIPGCALGIVQNSRTYLKGYGTLNMNENLPVNENSIFGMASLTKAFASASLAILIDEGKCSWDDLIISHLPNFSVQDSYVTNKMTIKDMLCHRSGMPEGAGDLLFWPTSEGRTTDDIFKALKNIKMNDKFRDSFNYNNNFYMIAGLLIESISGIPWPQFFEKRIFTPLGMTNTRATIIEFFREKNDTIATPHTLPAIKMNEDIEQHKKKLIPFSEMLLNEGLSLGPCGSIGSCVSDMVKWIQVFLDKGKPLFSEKQFTEIFRIQVGLSAGNFSHIDYKTSFSGYCLAWNVREYKNNIYWTHGGGLTGMICKIVVVPKLNFGFILNINSQEGTALNAMIYHILDHFGSGKTLDNFESNNENDYHLDVAIADQERSINNRQRQIEQIYNSRPTDTQPLDLGLYVGTYYDVWFGNVIINLVETEFSKELEISFEKSPLLKCRLCHWANNTFLLEFDERIDANAFIDFHVTDFMSVDSFKLRKFDSYVDFSYDYENTHFHKKSWF